MAKYRHRTFEMFEYHEEAAAALTVKGRDSARVPGQADGESFDHLSVTTLENIVHVRFSSPDSNDSDESRQLRHDLARLAKCLQNDSRVILDFAGVATFSSASVAALETFYQRLKNKGSRLVLCNLEDDAKMSFYPQRVPR